MSIVEQTVLITGATSGIGNGVARQLIALGNRVIVTGRNQMALMELQRLAPAKVTAVNADLAKAGDVDDLLSQVHSVSPSGVNTLVYCTGHANLGLLENVPLDQIRQDFETQVFALIEIVRALLPQWKDKKSGKILVVSSGVAYRGLPGAGAYCAPKAAQLSVLETLAAELESFGVQVIAYSPGLTDSSFQKNATIYGSVPFDFAEGRMISVDKAVQNLMKALNGGGFHVEKSFRGRVARILNSFAPNFFHRLITNKFSLPGVK